MLLLELFNLLISRLVALIMTGVIRCGLRIDEIVTLLQQPVIVDYHTTAACTVW